MNTFEFSGTKIFSKTPYDRAHHLIGKSVKEKRKFLSSKNNYPRLLYKYKDCSNSDYLRSLIVDSHFYMSGRQQLNDPFDIQSVIEFSAGGVNRTEYLNNLVKTHGLTYKKRQELRARFESPNEIQNHIRDYLTNAINGTGIHSFSTSPSNLLLWSHYGKSHTGVCLVFNTARDLDTFVTILPVNYSHFFPVIHYTQGIAGDLIKNAFLTKSLDWKYEDEWRLFEPKKAGHLMSYNSKSLVGVILGARISDKDKLMVFGLLKERKQRRLHTPWVYQAKCSSTAYEVEFNRILVKDALATR